MIYVSGNLRMFRTFNISSRKQDSDDCDKDVTNSDSFISLLELVKLEDCLISSICFSWSYCLIITVNEAFLVGFLNNHFGRLVKLSIPDDSKIIEGCCTNFRCNFVNNFGNFWTYSIKNGEWRNVTNLLRIDRRITDSPESDSSEKSTEMFVYKVSSGDHMTIAVTNEGIYSVPSLLTSPSLKVLEVTCGKDHTIVLTDVGTVYTWGNGSRGQLGHGELDIQVDPREVDALTGLAVVKVAAGGWHSCCLTIQGDLYSWGWNSDGQLGFPGKDLSGTGRTETSIVSILVEPKPIDWSDDQVTVTQVSCGSRHTVVVLGDGTVWGCGWNKYGQLHKDELPEKVFCMTKLNLPDEIATARCTLTIKCSEWNTIFNTC